MAKRDNSPQGIDEEFLRRSLKVQPVRERQEAACSEAQGEDGGRTNGVICPPVKEEAGSGAAYASLYFRRRTISNRQNVYISRELLTVLSEIVRMSGAENQSVSGLIETVMREHIETHQEALDELYRAELTKKGKAGLRLP